MKVLHIITKSSWGGAQRHVFDIVGNLSKEHFDVSVACGVEDDNSPLVSRLVAAGVPVHEIKSLCRDVKIFNDVLAFFELCALIKKQCPDIVHLHSSKVGLLGSLAARLSGAQKIIFTAHGTPFNEDRHLLSRLILYILSYLTVLCSHKTICVSKKVMHDYPKLLRSSHLTVVHNGIDEPIYLKKADARQTLNISPTTFCIGVIAELHPNKGLSVLLKSLAYIKKIDETKIEVHIIGGGQDESKLINYIVKNKLESIVFLHGFMPDAYRYIPAFDIFVLPSINEGLPYVLLEAGLAKVAIIASDVGGISELVIDGTTGLLTPSKSSKALADKISLLMADKTLNKTLAENMQRHIQTNFSQQGMMEKILMLYRN